MKIKDESLLYCPDCGAKLEFSYESEGRHIYYCPEGDEEYYFEKKDGYLYCVCLYDGKRECYGTA